MVLGIGVTSIPSLYLLDLSLFHSVLNVGGRSILLGSTLCCLGGKVPGYNLPLYPANSGSLLQAEMRTIMLKTRRNSKY